MNDFSSFKPYWLRHPHQLRVFSLFTLLFLPVVLLISALFVAPWREIGRQIALVYGELWQGLTHRLPSKPIVRPLAVFLAWFLALMLPQAAIVLVFNLFAPHAPLWTFIVLYAGLALFDIAVREHERKKARDKAGLDEHAMYWADR